MHIYFEFWRQILFVLLLYSLYKKELNNVVVLFLLKSGG